MCLTKHAPHSTRRKCNDSRIQESSSTKYNPKKGKILIELTGLMFPVGTITCGRTCTETLTYPGEMKRQISIDFSVGIHYDCNSRTRIIYLIITFYRCRVQLPCDYDTSIVRRVDINETTKHCQEFLRIRHQNSQLFP